MHPHTPALALDDLASSPRWVAWQTELRGERLTKVPYAPCADMRAKSDDPATWGSRQEAETRAGRLPRPKGLGGVGLVLGDLGNGYGVGGVDLDACIDTEGQLARWASEMLERFATYAETSPSGTGVKAFFRYRSADLPALLDLIASKGGRTWRAPDGGKHGPAIELYLQGRYFAVTAQCLGKMPLDLRVVEMEVLRWVILDAGPRLKCGPANATETPAGDGDILARVYGIARHNNALACTLGQLAGMGRSEAALALGAALKRARFTYDDMVAALAAHPDTSAWTREKGEADGGRELRRIWDKAEEPETQAREWPDLQLDLAISETAPPPAFNPGNIFSPGWARWVTTAAEQKGAPADYIALPLLSVAGALIGNARHVEAWDGWCEPPMLNTALVGNPSAGKSPALDALVKPLSELESAQNADSALRAREHATALQAAKEHRARWEVQVKKAVNEGDPAPRMPADAEEPPHPERCRIFSTDPTVAKAERMSAANPRGLLLQRDELAGWLGGMDRFASGKGSDRAFWLQAYGARPWSPDRVKDGDREVSVPHLSWAIVGGIQPDRLASMLFAGDDDGLAARFLYTWPTPSAPRRPPAGLELEPVLPRLERLRTLPWAPPEPVVVKLSPGAQHLFQQWREEAAGLEQEASGLFLGWLGKLGGTALRLALILEYLNWAETGQGDPPSVVSLGAMERAVDFLESYAVPMARRCFGDAALPEAEHDARKLVRWLVRRPEPVAVANVQALRRMAGGPGIPTADRLKAALQELAGLGVVRPATPERSDRGGRAPGNWEVNPAVWEARHGLA